MKSKSIPPSPHGVMPYNMLVGNIIQQLRERAGKSQSDVALSIGLTQSAYSRVESGQTSLTVSLLRLISVTLETTPEKILSKAELLSKQLADKGVAVPAEKPTDDKDLKSGLLIGLGILVFLLAVSK